MYKQKSESGLIVSVLHFVCVDLYAKGYNLYVPALYSWLGFSVSVTTSLLIDCYSVSATTSIFHFPEWCGDPSVYLFHHDQTLMALTANLVLLNSIIYVHLSSNGTEYPGVYLFHHDQTLMAWPLIWYYLIALYMFIWVVMGQSPHQGHWAMCCLWMSYVYYEYTC